MSDEPIVPIPQDLPEQTLSVGQRIENIYGILIRVQDTPDWTPKTFYEAFAVDTTNNRFYWYDFDNNAWKYTTHNLTLDSLLPSQTGNSGKYLTTNGSIASWGEVTSLGLVSVTAGELLTAGEVVCIKLGTGDYSTQGYLWSNGSPYAVRAAANDTTYGANVLGIVYTGASYLGTAQVALIGSITGLTGLTVGSKHYLSNYSGSSSETITQTTYNTVEAINTNIYQQVFVPTSSRLDKVVLYCKRNGGGGIEITVELRRNYTVLASAAANPPNDNTLRETTFDFTDARVYKGELLTLRITCDDPGTNSLYFAYQSTGDAYAGQYQGNSSGVDLTGGSVPASGADLYMKVFEYTDFGKIGDAAGTRKFKMGQALSSTNLALSMQEADTTL